MKKNQTEPKMLLNDLFPRSFLTYYLVMPLCYSLIQIMFFSLSTEIVIKFSTFVSSINDFNLTVRCE